MRVMTIMMFCITSTIPKALLLVYVVAKKKTYQNKNGTSALIFFFHIRRETWSKKRIIQVQHVEDNHMLQISILINDQGTKTNNHTSPQIEAGKFQRTNK